MPFTVHIIWSGCSEQALEPQQAERGDSCSVFYFAVADHPFNFGQRECPRYEVLFLVVEIGVSALQSGGEVYVVTLVGVPVRFKEMSDVHQPSGDQPSLLS